MSFATRKHACIAKGGITRIPANNWSIAVSRRHSYSKWRRVSGNTPACPSSNIPNMSPVPPSLQFQQRSRNRWVHVRKDWCRESYFRTKLFAGLDSAVYSEVTNSKSTLTQLSHLKMIGWLYVTNSKRCVKLMNIEEVQPHSLPLPSYYAFVMDMHYTTEGSIVHQYYSMTLSTRT